MVFSVGNDPKSLLAINRGSYRNPASVRMGNKTPAFKGAPITTTFSLIQTHEIAGPTLVNILSMVIPRSLIDFTRSKEAGLETARRETTSLVSSSLLPGFYGLGAGWLFSKLYNPYGVKGTIPSNNSTLNYIKEAWDNSGKKDFSTENIRKYVDNILDGAKKYENGKRVSLTKGADKETVAREFTDFLKKSLQGKAGKKDLNRLNNIAVKAFKAEQEINIGSIETSMKHLVEGSRDMMTEVFHKYRDPEVLESVFNKLKTIGRKRTVAGLSIAATIGIGTQFVNRYLTKRKTGSSDFVGLPDYKERTKQKSDRKENFGWKLAGAKVASVATMGYLLGASLSESLSLKKIGKFFTSERHEFIKKMQFKGRFPSLNQLRLLAALTYSGRMLASADLNELRETNIRDIFGFLNWLVFGGIIAKFAGKTLFDGEFLNEKEKFQGGGRLKKALHTVKNTFFMTEGEIRSMFPEKQAKKLLVRRNFCIGTGLLYSTLVLGLAIPLFNKYVTNKVASDRPSERPGGSAATENLSARDSFEKNRLIVEKTLGSFNNNISNPFMPVLNQDMEKSVYEGFLKSRNKYLKG